MKRHRLAYLLNACLAQFAPLKMCDGDVLPSPEGGNSRCDCLLRGWLWEITIIL